MVRRWYRCFILSSRVARGLVSALKSSFWVFAQNIFVLASNLDIDTKMYWSVGEVWGWFLVVLVFLQYWSSAAKTDHLVVLACESLHVCTVCIWGCEQTGFVWKFSMRYNIYKCSFIYYISSHEQIGEQNLVPTSTCRSTSSISICTSSKQETIVLSIGPALKKQFRLRWPRAEPSLTNSTRPECSVN